jgi:hypothetical protein
MKKIITIESEGSVISPSCRINPDLVEIYSLDIIDEQNDTSTAYSDPAYDISSLAVSTNIHDLVTEHDHYLYGVPKKVYE